jgi:hypothetical protein
MEAYYVWMALQGEYERLPKARCLDDVIYLMTGASLGGQNVAGSKGGPTWPGQKVAQRGRVKRWPGQKVAICFTQLRDRPARLGYDGRDCEIARCDRIATIAPIVRLIAHESKRDAF